MLNIATTTMNLYDTLVCVEKRDLRTLTSAHLTPSTDPKTKRSFMFRRMIQQLVDERNIKKLERSQTHGKQQN